jgi:hypothetical protein
MRTIRLIYRYAAVAAMLVAASALSVADKQTPATLN